MIKSSLAGLFYGKNLPVQLKQFTIIVMDQENQKYVYYDPSHPHLSTLSLKRRKGKRSVGKIALRGILVLAFFAVEIMMMLAIADTQVAYSPVKSEVVAGVKPPKQVAKIEKALERPPMLALADMYLVIPKLYINAPIDPVGVTPTGEMATSPSLQRIAWYKDGTKPGAPGSAVFAGHYGGPQEVGIFRTIDKLTVGDTFEVRSKSGSSTKYKVYKSATFLVKDVPLQELFNKNDGSYINLVTCVGNWDSAANSYDKRLIVYAQKQ